MRVNIYGEEISDQRFEVFTKEVEDKTFYAFRIYLKFPNSDWWIHRKVNGIKDDDSSAVTFWFISRDHMLEFFDNIFRHAIAE